MATVGPVYRRGIRRPQVIWSSDNKLRTTGRQLEAEAGLNGSLGPIITPSTSIRQAIGMLGSDGGRLFFSEGVWIFNGHITTGITNVHFLSTSPGKTVFKRPSTITTSTHMLTFTGANVTVEGIRFIDEDDSARSALRMDGDDSTLRNCVFEDVVVGVFFGDGDRVTVKCNRFQTVRGRAVEFGGTTTGHIISDNTFTPSIDGDDDVFLGDSVSESGIFSNNFGSSGKISYKTGKNNVGDETTNVIQAGDVTVRP